MYVPHARFVSLSRSQVLALTGGILVLLGGLLRPHGPWPTPFLPTTHKTAARFGDLPLAFVPNQGQTDAAVQMVVRALGGTTFFKPNEIVLSLPTTSVKTKTAVISFATVALHLDGANPTAQVSGVERLPGIVNYFVGNNPAAWRTNLPTYAGTVYHQVYPGIDLRYDGTNRQLKSTYTIAPGANPSHIRWHYTGASQVAVDASGSLHVGLSNPAAANDGSAINPVLIEQAPVAWQTIAGQRVGVDVQYRVAANGEVRFAVGHYDLGQPLTIDPLYSYSTFFGGAGIDDGYAIAVDGQGSAYITGYTTSTNLPTVSPLRPALAGTSDAFVAKLNAQGTALVYATYLGGSGGENLFQNGGIAVDAAGNAYVTGLTTSLDFPLVNPIQSTGEAINGDAFVTKLNAAGNALLYSTYLGGGLRDGGESIAVDGQGNAYVTGEAGSSFPTTPGAFQPTKTSGAFVAKLNPQGSALVYSTYLAGSSGVDTGYGIAVDGQGNAYVAGVTQSVDFPVKNPVQATLGGSNDAFIAELNPQGTDLVFATYLGGSGSDAAYGLAIDPTGNVYVTGSTNSTNFPTANAFQATFGGGRADAFVAKLNAQGTAFVYSTYLGGSGDDNFSGVYGGIAVDAEGNAYVTGVTGSDNFPVARPLQAKRGASSVDAFVTKLDPTGRSLLFSTYLGGIDDDVGFGIALDQAGSIYVTGSTRSSDFPLQHPVQPQLGSTNGLTDAFVTKIGLQQSYIPLITK